MRIPLRRSISAIIGWFISNCIAWILSAKFLGRILPQAEQRKLPTLDASLLKILDQALRERHTCLPLALLMTRAEERLGSNRASPEEILRALWRLQNQQLIQVTNDYVSLTKCALAEETIAKGLAHIGQRTRAINPFRLSQFLESSGIHLSDEKRDAIRLIVNTPVSILTGAPGTGKTSTIKALLAVFEQFGYRVRLAAPTGRAAQRLLEVTGHPTQTLHRMLTAYSPETPSAWNEILPVADVVIVDEASMIDLFLMARLVRICSPSMRLILVGDINQLPSIGAGQVLFDLIGSGVIPVVELRKNFRQANGSQIITAAEAIKEGRVPDLPTPGKLKSDCYFIEVERDTGIERMVINAATISLPARCGADPSHDIQILTPKHKGLLGTASLNERIQAALCKFRVNCSSPVHSFLPGDRVLHTKNDYQLNVFNGLCGIVQKTTNETVTVKFGEREVNYSRVTLHQLIHGFAVSIHRSQGSEYPFVIIPIHESQYPMLSRELLYTALTRGQKMVVLIGSRRALEMAVENSVKGTIHTGLRQKLITTMPSQFKYCAA